MLRDVGLDFFCKTTQKIVIYGDMGVSGERRRSLAHLTVCDSSPFWIIYEPGMGMGLRGAVTSHHAGQVVRDTMAFWTGLCNTYVSGELKLSCTAPES